MFVNSDVTVFIANWMVAVNKGRRAKSHNAALLKRIHEISVDVPSQATV